MGGNSVVELRNEETRFRDTTISMNESALGLILLLWRPKIIVVNKLNA